ncbi:uncharacterized protein LOC134654484 [Cydia amplana]|uniref:uncharacterized protein LOC134654484 n=1 Tax=Cydia amplana TaxID=1869771 RepID=UPI002FE55B15
MESLISYQEEISDRISRAKVNFKKSPKERITQIYVEGRLELLEQLWSEFRVGHKELSQTVDKTLLKSQDYIKKDVYNTTEEMYMEYKCDLKLILANLQPATISKSNELTVVNNDQSHIRLPKISIPSFSGKYTEWITFRDLFVSIIHNNKTLDNVQKLHYLKGYLTGEAEQIIRYTPVTEANYMTCWKLLEERYSNKKYLSYSILKRLLNQRTANSESASHLKELLDTFSDCLSALTNLGIDVSTWDIIVIYLLSSKLDPESRKQWELSVTSNVNPNDLPTFTQFKDFLASRYRALEFLEPGSKGKNMYVKPSTSNATSSKTFYANDSVTLVCEFCSENHKLCFCKKFAAEDYEKRHEFVANNRICYNCLGANHSVRFCQSTMNCRICNKRHHLLLHPKGVSTSTAHVRNVDQAVSASSEEIVEIQTESDSSSNDIASQSPQVTLFTNRKVKQQVLLATALVKAESKTGQFQIYRAFIDQGSESSFITEATVQGLGLKNVPIKSTITMLEETSVTTNYMVLLKLKSLINPDFNVQLVAYVLPKITTNLPARKVDASEWPHLQNLVLADPGYGTPNKIDILLGAVVYAQILEEGVKKGPVGTPIAQCTSFGWILSGGSADHNERKVVLHAQVDTDNEIIKRFWEMESEPLLNSKEMLTTEEQRCEDIFSATTTRDKLGRYVVKLPFRDENPACKEGNSREIAIKRFSSLERKFAKDKNLKEKYTAVVKEYLQLDHMVLVPAARESENQAVYLPHHAVIREDKSTSKVRVVFDASCKNEKGISLNDSLMVGPTLQPELRHLIMQWRMHPVCLIADIVKMYRMVRVTDQDADYQRIVWRDNQNEEIKDYKLVTVTFGTASAPYFAVKALNQVAIDHASEHPMAAKRVAGSFYMDDLMTGCETIEEGIELYKDMKTLLKKGGFTLQKWASNKEDIQSAIDIYEKGETVLEREERNLEIKQDNIVKILGLTWNKRKDEFQYSVTLPPVSAPVTKRKIVSDVA